MSRILILLMTLITYCLQGQYHLIPQAKNLVYEDMKILYDNTVVINPESFAANEAGLLKNKLIAKNYLVNSTTKKSLKIDIVQDKNLANEAYDLSLTKTHMLLKASSAAGAYYGIETILQILPNTALATYGLQAFTINDQPTYPWRGLMLDVSRHFFSVDDVKKYIDVMAQYKYNVLHWHLTDDEGWRIEIKSMPKLTEVGAWRAVRHGKFGEARSMPAMDEPKTYGGFYTQEQIKEVVNYAAKKHIKIVPEIDVPGHSMALLAAYPELSTLKEKKQVSCGFKFAEWYGNGTFKMLIENTLNPADENVYAALDKIFTEVAALFPGEYIHIGGDECYHGYWEADKSCQQLMAKEKLDGVMGLQSYFIKRVAKIIASKGKKLIGWDEILYGGLADGAAVMSWRGMEGGIKAAKEGHKVVMTPTEYCYIDYTQSDHSLELPIYSDLYLKTAYQFNPLPDGINKDMILGGQANLWTEQIPHMDHAMYMTYPRALAISETLWSGQSKKDWSGFCDRLESHFLRFDAADIPISKAVYDPIVKVKKDGNLLKAVLSCDLPNTTTHYTIDNTFPTLRSPSYSSEILLPEGDYTLRVVTYRGKQAIGRMLYLSRKELESRVR